MNWIHWNKFKIISKLSIKKRQEKYQNKPMFQPKKGLVNRINSSITVRPHPTYFFGLSTVFKSNKNQICFKSSYEMNQVIQPEMSHK